MICRIDKDGVSGYEGNPITKSRWQAIWASLLIDITPVSFALLRKHAQFSTVQT